MHDNDEPSWYPTNITLPDQQSFSNIIEKKTFERTNLQQKFKQKN